MKKKVFLAGYVNYINAQNINCKSLAIHLNKEKYEIRTMSLNSFPNVFIDHVNVIKVSNNKLSIAEANAQLKALTFTGTTRGDAKITVTVSDGFSQVSDSIFFSVPNTSPVITVPSTPLSGTIGGGILNLTGLKLTDADTADSGTSASMSLSLTASSGVFDEKSLQLTDTDQDYDHDSDSETTALDVKTFSEGDNNIYIVSDGSIKTLLNPINAEDLTKGFSKANLSVTGLGFETLELSGNLESISKSLSFIGLQMRLISPSL